MFDSHPYIGRPHRYILQLSEFTNLEFTQTNVAGFKKILKKYDKHFRLKNKL